MMKVPLSGRRGAGLVALVDDADFELVSDRYWNLHSAGYAVTRGSIYMHILIMGTKGIDHRDGNKLNNQRGNLRVASHAENHQNRHYGYGASQHRGVTFQRRAGKWQAQVKLNGKIHYLGLYTDEEDAARVAAAFRAEHMPFSAEASGDPDADHLYRIRPERTEA
jgi:hypothetical protein